VLVVDAQRDVADMFASLLETLGQDVKVAYTVDAALALTREHRPRIAFLDVSMPDMTGSELARRLRQQFPQSELTLVAVTGHGKAHGAVQDSRFDHYLLKPVTAEGVATMLNALSARPATPPSATLFHVDIT
jgi:CheY-like chemotaxis protein